MLPGKKYTPEDMLWLVWQRKWLVIVPLFVCSLTALLVSRFMPNKYQSETLIQVVPQRVPENYVKPTVTAKIEDRLQSMSQQIMSRTRLERIIQEFNLYADERRTGIMEDIVEQMRRDIRVDIARQADAFTIRFISSDPRTAMRVTERLASLFIDENLRDRGNLAEATNEFLETQLVDARKRLEAQEKRLEEFRRQYSGQLPSQLQSNMQALHNKQLQVQALVESISRDRDRRLMIERLFNDAKAELDARRTAAALPFGRGPGGDPDAATANVPLTAAQQLEAARLALAQLQLRLKPEHPDIVRLKRQITDLEKKAEAEALQQPLSGEEKPVVRAANPEEGLLQRRMQEMRAEIESLDRQIAFKEAEERRERAEIASYQHRIDSVPGIESMWVALTRDYDTLQKTYQELLAKSEDSKVAANLERRQIGEQFKVLDPARLPERPISPDRRMINASGLGIGLAIGLVLIALLEYLDRSLRTETDVVSTLALPVLVSVPLVTSERERRQKRRHRLMLSTAAGFGMVVVTGALFWTLKLWHYLV